MSFQVGVLRVLASESSMHAYSPYFAPFVAREVNANLTCLPLLSALMRFTQACLALTLTLTLTLALTLALTAAHRADAVHAG